MNRFIGKKRIALLFAFFAMLFMIKTAAFAENLNVSFSYGIHNVAKNGKEFPINIHIENRDSQDFDGYMIINIFEDNTSTFMYRADLNIKARGSVECTRNVMISNVLNTLTINVYNRKEELVMNERTNIDLSYYNDRLIIGAISSDYQSLSYVDNLLLTNTSIQTKLVELTEEDVKHNKNIMDLIDLLIINDVDLSSFGNEFNQAITNFGLSGKSMIIGLGGENGINSLPGFLNRYLIESHPVSYKKIYFNFINAKVIEEYVDETDIEMLNVDDSFIICLPYSLSSMTNHNDNDAWFINLINKCLSRTWLAKIINSSNAILYNDYYNISNLLNIINKERLPEIFVITALLVFYLSVLTIIIYVFLRNINKREEYGKYALVFSVIYTVIMLLFGNAIMRKNTFLTYLSIVNIKGADAKEKAFLSFRTSERGDYRFDTDINVKLNPILRNNRQPIFALDFVNANNVKTTTFEEVNDRKVVTVLNAKDFDSNIFEYDNINYLNDVYNVTSSFRRFDGEVTGRITNNMSITIRDAKVLLFGKILDIGDIEPSHSVSLSRAKNLGAPVANNAMIADLLADDINQNIVKYYLDENVAGYYDYGLLIGFIDNNGTIDINSNDVGEVYGRTLLVTRVNKDNDSVMDDICSLQNDVSNMEGNYDFTTNTTNGDGEVINEYVFDATNIISKVYFEGIGDYEHGKLDASVPFYGDIQVYNYQTQKYDTIAGNSIGVDKLQNVLTPDNRLVVKFVPSSRDPLYRRISLPVVRAIVSK